MIAKTGWRLGVLVALMLLVGLTEGLGTALLFSLLVRLGISGSSDPDGMTGSIEWFLDSINPNGGAVFVLGVLVVMALTQAILFINQSWQMSSMARRYAARWQVDLFAAFIKSDWLFLTERKSADLVNAIVVETGRLTASFLGISQLVAAAIVAVVYLVVALFVSWQTTLLLTGLALFMLLSIVRLYRTSYRIGHQTGPFNASMLAACSELLQSAKIVKTSGAEGRAIARFATAADNLQRVSRVANFLPNLVRGVFELIGVVGIAGLLVVGVSELHVATANLLVVLALFVRLLPRITALQTQLHSLNTFVPVVLNLGDLLGRAQARQERTAGAALPALNRPALSCENINIAYGERCVIRDLNLNIPLPGLYGIVGGSGAGKSSLMHALVGLVPIESGSIRLGLMNLADASLASWRRAVALVPQETALFNNSVRENLIIATPDASMDEIVAAAKAANAHEFVMKLDRQYETPIGDQGVLLSGGQRQRLGIARALLMQPSLLLLDEPTSSLDTESEAEVLETLHRLRQSIGIVVVAHRLATVRHADRIFVLEDGSVIENGTWSELVGNRRRFYDLARAQHIVMAGTPG
jgi:ATP-binding cassette, subfamily C, bacterial